MPSPESTIQPRPLSVYVSSSKTVSSWWSPFPLMIAYCGKLKVSEEVYMKVKVCLYASDSHITCLKSLKYCCLT